MNNQERNCGNCDYLIAADHKGKPLMCGTARDVYSVGKGGRCPNWKEKSVALTLPSFSAPTRSGTAYYTEPRPPIPTPAQSGTALDATHYQGGRSEPIEDMQDDFSQEGMEGFLRGNILKYVRRFGKKGPKLSDAQKIAQYAKWLVDVCEGRTIDPREEG